jgi:hypothetical protein
MPNRDSHASAQESGRGSAEDSSVAERDRIAYEVLTQRELEHQSLIWQTPGLSLTAQAFLLTIALGSGSSSVARIIAAILGICAGLLTMQLMDKHRILYALERAQLDLLAHSMRLPPITYLDPKTLEAAFTTSGAPGYHPIPKWRFWHNFRSMIIWQLGLGCFVIANAAIVVIVASGHASLLAK